MLGKKLEKYDTSEAGAEVWMKDGLCKDLDPDIFFPSDGAGVEVARKICRKCVVKEHCLEYALDNRIDHGVWGGSSERERRRILRVRRLERLASINSQ